MIRVTPDATYRLQLGAGFGFADAAAVAPYLARLGVTHAYTSPVAQAVADSAHGYDGVDPTRVGGKPLGAGVWDLFIRLRDWGAGNNVTRRLGAVRVDGLDTDVEPAVDEAAQLRLSGSTG